MSARAAKRPHWLRLRSRFTLLVCLGVGLVSLALALMTYLGSREALLEARQEQLLALAQAQAAELGFYLQEVTGPARDLASTLEVCHPRDADQATEILAHQLEEAPKVFGMALAYEPLALDGRTRLLAPYVHRTPQGIKRLDLVDPAYDYLHQDWFLVPTLLERPVWAEPYFDEGGGQIIMTTYSAPMVKDGRVLGVVTADVDLDLLGKEVRQLVVGKKGHAFLVTGQGTFLAAPEESWVMRESIFSLAEALDRPDLRQLGRRLVRGQTGILSLPDPRDGRPCWLAFAPVRGPGWALAVVQPEEEVLAPVARLAKRQALMAVGGLAVLVAVIWYMVMRLTRPLRRLAAGSRRLAQGNLDTRVEDVRAGDEIGDLAQSFNCMVGELKRYVEELTATTKNKERIQSELDLARQIQQSVLPRTYPPFPERPEFDLFARTLPAREVGGDFYDFFLIDPEHLGLVVADVSGKGVPAALFMTVTRTLIKNAAQHHPDPARTLSEVNAQIIPDNEMCMFVTAFYGVYEIATGLLRWVSAGHPAPLLRRADGTVEFLPQLHGLAIGIMDDLNLRAGEITLAPDDALLVFTDGLDEAIDPDEQMFGQERAKAWLAQSRATDAPIMLEDLIATWRAFTGAAEQFDDLTLLLLRRSL